MSSATPPRYDRAGRREADRLLGRIRELVRQRRELEATGADERVRDIRDAEIEESRSRFASVIKAELARGAG